MIPAPLFQRITLTGTVRTERRPNERRGAARIPCQIRATLFSIRAGRALPGQSVRLKDISQSGIGVIAPHDLQLTPDFVIRLSRPGTPDVHLHCKIRRRTSATGGCAVAGCSFERLLAPGQQFAENTSPDTYLWLDVAGTITPEDPFGDPAFSGLVASR